MSYFIESTCNTHNVSSWHSTIAIITINQNLLLLHHATNSRESFGKEPTILKEESTTHISNSILLQGNMETISAFIHFIDYFLDTHFRMFIFFNEECIFCKSARINPNRDLILVSDCSHLLQILKWYWLSSGCVVGYCNHN